MGKGTALRFFGGLLLGLAALAAVMAGFILTNNHQDSRPMVVLIFVVFFVGGSVAAGGRTPWPGGLGVALGGISSALLLSYLKIALTDLVFLGIYVAVALAALFAGAWVRRLAMDGGPRNATAVGTAALAAAVGVGFGLVPTIVQHAAYRSAEQTVAPFRLRTLDGRLVSSRDWRGRVAVISYWATWCTPCLAEMPEIADVQRRYKADPRVVILAVNAGYGGDTAEKAAAFLSRRNVQGDVAIDDLKAPGDKRGEGGRSLGLKVVPTLFILDRAGKLSTVHVGFDNAEQLATTLSDHIDRLVARP